MFDTLNKAQQGDLGEARAIYELVKLGYAISTPLHVHLPYDLIADKDGVLYRVQVKTTKHVSSAATRSYEVMLATNGGNTKSNNRKQFDASLIDMLFVVTDDDRCWLIPASVISSKSTLTIGTPRYAEYQISGSVHSVEVEIEHGGHGDRRRVNPPFTADELQHLLLTMPTVEIACRYNMSDNGIARWAKKWALQKPPRGFWQKQRSQQARSNPT